METEHNKTSVFEIALKVFSATTLDDKCHAWNFPFSDVDFDAPPSVPSPLGSMDPGKLDFRATESLPFPSTKEFKDARARAIALYFFANHELLAIDSMAYVLLKFPQAPVDFLRGVYGTLRDEQKHLMKYAQRMKELAGFDVGDFKMNSYFWQHLKSIQSPKDYVCRMSLVFEQANLDFAAEYAEHMRTSGDAVSASILDSVLQDEISHVRHGVQWQSYFFDREQASESSSQVSLNLWEDFVKSIPFPLNARRARGNKFFGEPRLQAGLSRDFVDRIRIAGGSRGRAPLAWHINLGDERIERDLETLPAWWALESDQVVVRRCPDLEWQKSVFALREQLPEWVQNPGPTAKWARWDDVKHSEKNDPRWGRIFFEGLIQKPKALVMSTQDLMDSFSVIRELAQGPTEKLIFKSNHGVSGRGHIVLSLAHLQEDHWPKLVQEKLKNQNQWGIERYYDRICDFSRQIEWNSQTQEYRVHDPRIFFVDGRFQYRGTELRKGDRQIFVNAIEESQDPLPRILEFLKLNHISHPIGLDGFIFLDENGVRKIRWVSEINLRFTMGWVALKLERYFPGNQFRLFSRADLKQRGVGTFLELENQLKSEERFCAAVTPTRTAQRLWGAVCTG